MGQVLSLCHEAHFRLMGIDEYDDQELVHTHATQVMLHVYDVGNTNFIRRANKVFRRLGTGAFHAGVEIFGVEYSFGYTDYGTGVFGVPPGGNIGHHYREALEMGETECSMHEVADILQDMADRWKGPEYDLLNHNCVYFCRDLLDELDVTPMPTWVVNLAGAGATVSGKVAKINVTSRAAADSIIKAAKAGQINAKFQAKAKFKRVKKGARHCASCNYFKDRLALPMEDVPEQQTLADLGSAEVQQTGDGMVSAREFLLAEGDSQSRPGHSTAAAVDP